MPDSLFPNSLFTQNAACCGGGAAQGFLIAAWCCGSGWLCLLCLSRHARLLRLASRREQRAVLPMQRRVRRRRPQQRLRRRRRIFAPLVCTRRCAVRFIAITACLGFQTSEPRSQSMCIQQTQKYCLTPFAMAIGPAQRLNHVSTLSRGPSAHLRNGSG